MSMKIKTIIGADFPKKGKKKESVRGLGLQIGIGFLLTYVLLSRMDSETLLAAGFTSVGSGMLTVLASFVCTGSLLMIPLWYVTRRHVKTMSKQKERFRELERRRDELSLRSKK